MSTHSQTVQQQFDPLATMYLESRVHASGPDLDWVTTWLARGEAPGDAALDVGSGPGHLAFRLAGRFGRVCAVDPSGAMLAAAAAESRRRQQPILTCQAHADALPIPDADFDLVATRFSAHHWVDVPGALREMRRVARPGGHLLLIDLLGDESPLVDTHLQAIELIRDPGHARDLTVVEWQAALRNAGWKSREFHSWPVRLDFGSWVARMRVPQKREALLREMLAEAPAEVRQALAVEADGSFTARIGLFLAQTE